MKRILVIDDDDLFRASVVNVLQQSGYAVVDTNDGEEGLRLAQANAPDLVISDVVMKKLDGFAVIEQLSQDPMTSTVPCIFMTGLKDQETARKGMELGAVAVLIKPFQLRGFLSAVEACLHKHRG